MLRINTDNNTYQPNELVSPVFISNDDIKIWNSNGIYRYLNILILTRKLMIILMTVMPIRDFIQFVTIHH